MTAAIPDLPDLPDAAQILRDAADGIELHGWTQGAYFLADGCMCMAGALASATRGDAGNPFIEPMQLYSYEADRFDAAVQLAVWLITGEWPEADSLDESIHLWNDVPGRTADEVVAALRAAADQADPR